MIAEECKPWRYRPFRPFSLDQLIDRLTREGLGEYAEFASAYAANSALVACLGDRSSNRLTKWRKDIAVTYQVFLVSELLGRPFDVAAHAGGMKREAVLDAYDKHRAEWEARGRKRLPQGMEEAYNFVTYLHKKRQG